MANPYLTTVALFAALGALAAVDAALASLGLTPFLLGLRWLRIHLVTLGLFTEAVFGLLPCLMSRAAGRPLPAPHRGRWLLLNVGLVTLLVGIPLVRAPMIAVGGTIVLIATLWLAVDLWRIGGGRSVSPSPAAGGDPAPGLAAAGFATGRPFYLAGLTLLLVGALVGTGLWLEWGPALGIARPKETHIHANLWGFASLVLAGLLVDLHGALRGGRAPDRSRSLRAAWWLMTGGALALVVAPWVAMDWLMVLGIAMYAAATALLYATLVWPLRPGAVSAAGSAPDRRPWAGSAHLLTAYLWILVPALALPFIVFGGASVPAARVEPVGPSILSYGWLLQTLVALLPPAIALAAGAGAGGSQGAGSGSGTDGRPDASEAPTRPLRLGGSPLSWAALNLCTLALVASVALPAQEAALQGLAFGLLAVALLWLARNLLPER